MLGLDLCFAVLGYIYGLGLDLHFAFWVSVFQSKFMQLLSACGVCVWRERVGRAVRGQVRARVKREFEHVRSRNQG